VVVGLREVPPEGHANLGPERALALSCGALEPAAELAVDEDRHRRRERQLGDRKATILAETFSRETTKAPR
jgi:hypothetical protein